MEAMKPACCDMRPPCCDKVGIKKGPWTPEEDIILSSYIQQHGPGKWKSVPTNTGLVRCSKSCRLRWTNYLRPGIKRGKFTPHEEVMIIHLQSSMGNKWAAIASHLPQRTDNDIKNYWNTHLKKKLKKFQSVLEPHQMASSSFKDSQAVAAAAAASSVLSRFKTTTTTSTTTTTYALSTKNISRLLESWARNSPKNQSKLVTQEENHMNNSHDLLPTTSSVHDEGIGNNRVIHKMELQNCENLMSHEEFESLISFENMGSSSSPSAGEKVSSLDPNVNGGGSHQTSSTHTDTSYKQQSPFCFIEEWLLDEAPTL